jgi:Fe-S cluster assembly iron-binding protein IscA
MLTITEEAARLICTLRTDAELREQAGLRVVVDAANRSLSMDLANAPAAGDTVVSGCGARVFLSPSAAYRLRAGTLRAEITNERSRFFLDR